MSKYKYQMFIESLNLHFTVITIITERELVAKLSTRAFVPQLMEQCIRFAE